MGAVTAPSAAAALGRATPAARARAAPPRGRRRPARPCRRRARRCTDVVEPVEGHGQPVAVPEGAGGHRLAVPDLRPPPPTTGRAAAPPPARRRRPAAAGRSRPARRAASRRARPSGSTTGPAGSASSSSASAAAAYTCGGGGSGAVSASPRRSISPVSSLPATTSGSLEQRAQEAGVGRHARGRRCCPSAPTSRARAVSPVRRPRR